MISLSDQLTLLNLLSCIILLLISVYGFVKIGNPTPLFIGAGFSAFAISHIISLMHLTDLLQIPLAVIRSLGYILVAIGISLIIREVIMRYTAEQALTISHERLEERVAERTAELQRKNEEQVMLLDTMDAQVWYLTDPATYGAVNRAHAEFFGVTRSDIEYHPVSRVLSGDFLAFCSERNREVFSSGVRITFDRWVPDREGVPRLFTVSKTPKVSRSGSVEYVVCVAVDTTERRREEERLILANRKLNMLSSVTRHDILNDIQILYTYLDLAGKKITDPILAGYHEKQLQAVEAIETQIAFTRFYQDIGVQTPVWQDIAEVIRNAARKVPDLRATIDVRFSGCRMLADPLFEKAIYNLIENAVRHGGQVTTITFTLEQENGAVTLICADDGVGIPDHEKKAIFEKGYGKNTGFGLFLIREILSITQVSITETGVAGAGAVFRIRIPGWAFSAEPRS